ncbi:MAG: DNA polymerase I [Planctomycetales bacterium 4572_13]|nr:MAG: DNA polymerase I [Planctomycetales bacterium 4572_13]
MSKKLYIIDGHAHIYSAYYAPMRPLTAPSGEPTKAVFVFTNALLGLIDRAKPDMLVVAMDSKAPSFRADMYPEYKAHRPPMPEDLPGQIKQIERILEAMNIPMLRVDGWEADDIIGTLTKEATEKDIDAYICSKDKDMLQLLNEHVVTYDIKKDVVTDTKKLKEDKGLTPEQFIDVLALQGDAADNIPGVPDVGPKTATDWIIKYGSLDELYAHADDIKGKRGDNLRKFKEQAYLSKDLVIINTKAPVTFDEQAFTHCDPDTDKLADLYKELGFSKLLSALEGRVGHAHAEKEERTKAKPTPIGGLFAGMEESRVGRAHAEANYELVDTQKKLDKFVEKLATQKAFAFDTETTSINAMRADLVGMSFSWKAHTGYYLPVKAPLGQPTLDIAKVRESIGPILADTKRFKVAQNLKYDYLVLENADLPVAVSDGKVFDTMVASYCLHADRASNGMDAMSRDYLGYEPIPISDLIGKGKKQITFDQVDTAVACEYAAEDAVVTWQLYEYLSVRLDGMPQIKELFETVEMPLVTVLARMEANGVSLDTALLRKMSNEMTEIVDRLTGQIYALAGIDSPKQLAEILFDRLGLTSLKKGKTQRSTDAGVLAHLRDDHEIIPLLLEYRQLVKLKNTYTDKLGKLINPRTERVHASFNQTVTATGRLSSSDPNLQNIPVRTEMGRKIRSAFIPAEKTACILSADYSQIELRLLAHFSKDAALLKAFADDQDIHRFVASQVYGVEPKAVTSEMRSKAKGVNFGIIYGQGPFGLAKAIGITQAEAKRFIADYYDRYPSIRSFMDNEIHKAKNLGYAETILHRRRPISGLNSNNFNMRSQAERLTINTVIQGSAADLIKVAMINIQRRIENENLPVKMTLQIHDELVFELPADHANEHSKWIRQEMTHAIELVVPLKVDVSIGSNWLTDK